MKRICICLLLLLMLTGCTSTAMKEAYRTHFLDESASVRTIENKIDIPRDILAQMPPDFRLANYVGLLTLIIDGDGKLKHGLNSHHSVLFIEHSQEFLELRERYSTDEFRTYSPVGYPHVIGIIPNIDVTAVLDLEAGQNWLRYFHAYYAKRDEKNATQAELDKILKEIANAEATKANLDDQLSDIRARIQAEQAAANRIRSEASRIKLLDGVPSSAMLTPLRIRYSYDDDMFRGVYESKVPHINGRIRTLGVENPHLQEETIRMIELANAIIAEPDKYFDSDKAAKISAAKLTPLTVISASRSILQQAALSSATKAKYLDSKHALGVAIDIQIKGTSYDVTDINPSAKNLGNYHLLLDVLTEAGFVRSTVFSNATERNHFCVSKYADYDNGLRNPGYDAEAYANLALSLFEDMSSAADNAMMTMLTSIYELNIHQQSALNSYHQISVDIKAKRETIEQEKISLAKAVTNRSEAERIKQAALERKARREEAERRERERVEAMRRENDLHIERMERMRERAERMEAERIHRERMERERRDMENRQRDIERQDRTRERMKPPGVGRGIDLA